MLPGVSWWSHARVIGRDRLTGNIVTEHMSMSFTADTLGVVPITAMCVTCGHNVPPMLVAPSPDGDRRVCQSCFETRIGRPIAGIDLAPHMRVVNAQ